MKLWTFFLQEYGLFFVIISRPLGEREGRRPSLEGGSGDAIPRNFFDFMLNLVASPAF